MAHAVPLESAYMSTRFLSPSSQALPQLLKSTFASHHIIIDSVARISIIFPSIFSVQFSFIHIPSLTLAANPIRSEVIDGWEILISTMALKEKAELTCPPQYAYGGPAARGSGGCL